LERNVFDRYLEACRAAGFRYDGSVQAGKVSGVPRLVRELRDRGFDVAMDPASAEAARAEIREREALDERRDERLDELEEMCGETLFEYQRRGAKWLMSRRGKGALLADDMGLGKTVQALMALDEDTPTLVVAPAVVKSVWAAEAEKFRPDLTPVVVHGRSSFRWPGRGEVVVTNYASLPGPACGEYEELGIEGLGDPLKGTVLVLDEVHYCKGRDSQRSRRSYALANAVRRVGGSTWGLSGTPMVNSPFEMWRVLSLLAVSWETFPTWTDFVDSFGLEKGDMGYERVRDPSPGVAEKLRRTMLRREKRDVVGQLPPKRYRDLRFSIRDDVSDAFDSVVEELGLSPDSELTDDGLRALATSEEHFRLRKLLAQVAVPEMLEEMAQHEYVDEPLVVFSSHVYPVKVAGARDGWACITGGTPMHERDEIIASFQDGKLKGVALTTGAAGTGITLTHATNALFVDLAWTPMENEQAEDRLHRIGQRGSVLITRLVADHWLVKRVLALLGEKQRLIRHSVGAASERSGDPGDADARALEEARVERFDFEESGEGEEGFDSGRLPSGRYAITGEDGTTDFYEVDRGAGKWDGWLFVSAVYGDSESPLGSVRPSGCVRGKNIGAVALSSILEKLARDPVEAMERYGREIGRCAVCGRRLTDEGSRERGIGPVCYHRVSSWGGGTMR
jgi:hypothetical protein